MKQFAVLVATLLVFVVVCVGLAVWAESTVPSLASHNVYVRAPRVAEDACAILVVDDYRGGLTGSTYRCAGPDREVTYAER